MKCECKRCDGTGEVTCPECDGEGGTEGGIEHIKLRDTMHNYEELVALQADARRVIKQAERLKELNPLRATAYDSQLRATFLAAVQRLAAVGEAAVLAFKGTRLTLTAAAKKGLPAKGEEVLPCENVKPIRLKVNLKYLVDALAATAVDEVICQFTDSISALVLRAPDGHWQTVIMPMRGEGLEEEVKE